jgi:hypothetical protein
MKRIHLLTICFVAFAGIFSCKPEAFKNVGTPTGNLDALNGNWRLTKVTQTDVDAQKKGFPFQTMDLTNVFPYTEFKMSFNVEAKTFTATPGNSPNILRLTSGSWAPDNVNAPQNLTLVNGTDTSRIVLGGYPNSVNPNLRLKVDRKDAAGKVLISYNYEFSKQP